jgi:hypothetical protein
VTRSALNQAAQSHVDGLFCREMFGGVWGKEEQIASCTTARRIFAANGNL